MAAKIRRDDEVVVIAGKDKGRRGKVLQVRPDNRVLVSELNLIKSTRSQIRRSVSKAVSLRKKHRFIFLT